MKLKNILLITLAVLMLGMTACGDDEPDEEVVAIVNDEEFTEDDLEWFEQQVLQMYEMYGIPIDEEDEEQMEQLTEEAVEEMITEAVLLQEAEERGISPDEDLVEGEIEAITSEFDSEEELEEVLEMYGMDKERLEREIRNSFKIEQLIENMMSEDEISEEELEVTEEELEDMYEHEKSANLDEGEEGEDYPDFDDRREELEERLMEDKRQEVLQEKIREKIEELREDSEIEILI